MRIHAVTLQEIDAGQYDQRVGCDPEHSDSIAQGILKNAF
jgi:hypothetical protein